MRILHPSPTFLQCILYLHECGYNRIQHYWMRHDSGSVQVYGQSMPLASVIELAYQQTVSSNPNGYTGEAFNRVIAFHLLILHNKKNGARIGQQHEYIVYATSTASLYNQIGLNSFSSLSNANRWNIGWKPAGKTVNTRIVSPYNDINSVIAAAAQWSICMLTSILRSQHKR